MNERLGLMEDQQRLRESLVRNLTPSARHQAFPALFAKPMPVADPAAEFQREVAALKRENEALRSTVGRLKEERGGLAEQLRVALEDATHARTRPRTRKTSVGEVQTAFCEAYSEVGKHPYTLVDLVSQRRSRAMAWPRMVCMDLVRQLCAVSFPVIGEAFGSRDHTTVMHALSKTPDHLAESPTLAEAHARVMARFTVRQ